jgi:hypothetical protein
MLDTFTQQKIRELVTMTRHDANAPLNLRVAWAKLGMVLGDERWSDATRTELDAINNAFESYLGKTEIARSGRGAPPPEIELTALLDAIRALERLLPVAERTMSPR